VHVGICQIHADPCCLAIRFGDPERGAPPNGVPLIFGMSAPLAAQVLGVPLNYVRGRSGDELFLATPNVKGSALSSRSDGRYLQFRKGRLGDGKAIGGRSDHDA